MEKEYYDNLMKNFKNGPIPYVNGAGIIAEVLEERHVRLRLPMTPLHLNHVGTAYAGSEFILAEIASGNIFKCTYDPAEFIVVAKNIEIRYKKPAKTDLICEISLSEEEAEEKIAYAREKGRGNWYLEAEITDAEGDVVAEVKFTHYAMPPIK